MSSVSPLQPRQVAAACVVLLSGFGLAAQPQFQPGATQDPLMALMLSQPRIDVDSPVVPAIVFDPPSVKPGQVAILRITFNALEASIKLPSKLPAPSGTIIEPAAHGQLLVLTGTNYQPRTTFNFRVRTSTPGRLVLPQFVAQVYGKSITVPAAEVEVRNDLPPGFPPAQTLKLELPRTNLYAGQSIQATVSLPAGTSLVLQHSSPLQINGDGFIADPTTLRPKLEARRLGPGNANISTILYELMVTPIASGHLKLFAQAFVGSRTAQAFIITPGGPVPALPQYTLVDSEPVEVRVTPLPKEGRLPGFTGAVGTFTTDPPQLSTNVLHVGEPVKLTVKVRGEGNLVRLVPPPPAQNEQWRIFPGGATATPPQIIQAQGFTTLNYTLIPLTDRARSTPRIPFSCFDPDEGKYVDCTIEAVPATVLPGTIPGDLAVIQQAEALSGSAEKEPVLSPPAGSPGLAASGLVPLQRQTWFPLLQLAPASALLALWGWDRRRRYYEAHPGVLLRKRARRALHREWRMARKAAANQDAPGFAAANVRALEVACSPFYPADPRALVGADVLALLPHSGQPDSRAAAIRDLFDAVDAARFASAPASPTASVQDASVLNSAALLRIKPELDSVLETLDERLRA